MKCFTVTVSIVLAAAAAGACSSSSSTQGTAGDAGATTDSAGSSGGTEDGGSADSAGPTSTIACGAAPFVNIGLVVRQVASGGGTAPAVEGATLTSSLCLGKSAITGPDGVITAQVTKSAPFVPRFDAPNYATTLIAELQFDADKTGIEAPLPPALFTALVPGFGPTKTAIIVGLSKGGGTGACDALDGVAFTVTGHPEAVVTYFTDDAIPQIAKGGVTTAAGRAAITELAVGAPVSIAGTKTGCTIDFARAPYTGKAPLEAGALTLVPAYVH